MLKNLLVNRFHLVFHTVRKDFEAYALTVANGGPKLTAAAPPDGPLSTRQPGVRQEVDKDGFPVFPPGYPNIVGIMREGVDRLSGRMVTTGDLLGVLRNFLGTGRLEDKTGLTDKYDLRLEHSLAGLPAPMALVGRAGAAADSASGPAPDLFTALETQLGLKLGKSKVPLDVVVIDHIEKHPTEN